MSRLVDIVCRIAYNPSMLYLTPKQLTAMIAKRRKSLGLSYAAAAKQIGMTRGNWCNIERNQRPTSAETLSRMAAAVGLKVDPQEVLRVYESGVNRKGRGTPKKIKGE